MSRYLITGNAGLIGSNLADHILTNTDDEVYGIDLLPKVILRVSLVQQSHHR